MKKKRIDKVGYASTLVMAFVFVYLICEIIYKLLNDNYAGNVTWEVVLLITIVLLFGLLTKDEVILNVPKSLLGEVLPLEKKLKKKRTNQYLLEGMVFSLFLCVMNIAAYVFGDSSDAIMLFTVVENYEIFNLIINTLVFFSVGTLIFYGFNYYICEKNVNTYTEYMKALSIQEKELRKDLKINTIDKKTRKKTV